MKGKIKKAVILFIWLCLWQITAFFVNNPIYFASPLQVLRELAVKAGDVVFWQSVGGSLIRILAGFFAAFLLAFITAFATLKSGLLESFLAPLVTFLKSVPIAAVVVILLIWWGPRYLVLCISLMVVFPNVYLNMQTGLKNADTGLLEMADVFELSAWERFLWIYRPAYQPHLHSAVSVAIGMCFKSGIAAEIIGLPQFSAGEQLYRDKIYLNTAGVFAWVVVILILSSLTERLFILGLKLLAKVPAACLQSSESAEATYTYNKNTPGSVRVHEDIAVHTEGIIKKYGDRAIVDTDISLKKGGIYYLNAPSGAGKSTLLGMLAGTVSPDSGSVQAGCISMVFQDDRLIEHANAARNLKLAGCVGDPGTELKKLLPGEIMMNPVSDLSGGERRRTAIARALLHPSDIVILDEPFAGLDEETKKLTSQWILGHLDGRTLIFATHGTEAEYFPNAQQIYLK